MTATAPELSSLASPHPTRETVQMWPAFTTWGQQRRQWVGDTPRYYHARIRQADRWLTTHRATTIEKATTADVQAWWNQLPTHPSTRNTYLAALVAFYDWYATTGMRRDNPAADVQRLRIRRGTPRAPHPETTEAILAEADQARTGGMVGCYLMAYAGLRIGECVRLRWTDFQAGWMTVVGKGEKVRELPVHPDLKVALNAWQATVGAGTWLVASPRGDGHVSTGTMRRWVKDIMADAGHPELVPHQLRHGAASRLLECGADVRTVQEFLGHASLATTAVYLTVRPVRLAEAVGAMTYAGP